MEELLKIENKWCEEKGNFSEFIIYTKVSFERNVRGIPFISKADPSEQKIVLEIVKDVLDLTGTEKEGIFLSEDTFDMKQIGILFEKHLISKKFLDNERKKGVFISNTGEVVITINEEEHIKSSFFAPGFNIEEAYENSKEIIENLGERIKFSFSKDYGFLLSSPFSSGSGMSIEALIHLPALGITSQIVKALDFIKEAGFNVKGFNFREKESNGFLLHVVSDKKVMKEEREMLDDFKNLIYDLIKMEEDMEKFLKEQAEIVLKDKVYKSLALLKNGLLFTLREALNLISNVRFGLRLGIVKELSFSLLNSLFFKVQPEHLKFFARDIEEKDIDVERANLLRSSFSKSIGTYREERSNYV